tara:strand:- start:347 stop:856 length:510 start_codon:yes stop_codon:yes gene_type:complete
MALTDLHKYTVAEKLNKMDVDLITINPTIETSTIDKDDNLFLSTEIPDAVSVKDDCSILQSICLIDTTDTSVDEGVQIDLIFSQNKANLGALDGAVTAADTLLDDILGIVSITNYVDMVQGQIATKNNIGLVLKPVDASKSVYIHGVIREAGTARAANAIFIRLGIIKD